MADSRREDSHDNFVRPGIIEIDLLVHKWPSSLQHQLSHGLVVEDVRNGATRTDLRPGDFILALINRGVQAEIRSVEQFNKLLSKFDKTSNITLLVRRGDSQTFITIKGVGDK